MTDREKLEIVALVLTYIEARRESDVDMGSEVVKDFLDGTAENEHYARVIDQLALRDDDGLPMKAVVQ